MRIPLPGNAKDSTKGHHKTVPLKTRFFKTTIENTALKRTIDDKELESPILIPGEKKDGLNY